MKITKKELNQIIESKVTRIISEATDQDIILKDVKLVRKFMNEMDKLSRKLKTEHFSNALGDISAELDDIVSDLGIEK